MALQVIATRLAFAYFVAHVFLLSFGALKACSNSTTVPINIEVQGRLIITDENSDNAGSARSLTVSNINLDRKGRSTTVLNDSRMRIRTNLSKWRLVAQVTDISTGKRRINPRFVAIRYETSAGSKGNPNAGRLVPPFNRVTSLSTISKGFPVTILEGKDKTSLERDKGNNNNWFGVNLTAEYVGNTTGIDSLRPRNKDKNKSKTYRAVISYALVSL